MALVHARDLRHHVARVVIVAVMYALKWTARMLVLVLATQLVHRVRQMCNVVVLQSVIMARAARWRFVEQEVNRVHSYKPVVQA